MVCAWCFWFYFIIFIVFVCDFNKFIGGDTLAPVIMEFNKNTTLPYQPTPSYPYTIVGSSNLFVSFETGPSYAFASGFTAEYVNSVYL